MKNIDNRKGTAIILLVVSVIFFAGGFMYPLLQTEHGIGPFTLKKENIYISTSFRYFLTREKSLLVCSYFFLPLSSTS